MTAASTTRRWRSLTSEQVAIRLLGVRIYLTAFLTGKDDPTIGSVSFLSRPREHHALAVGAIAATAPELVGLSAELAAGGAGLYVLGRTLRAWSDATTQHLRDAAEEPAYTALGYVGMHVPEYAPQLLEVLR